jgi:tetratricopeptide (TPR) repeat protein
MAKDLDNYLYLSKNAIDSNNCEEAINYVQKVLEEDIENSQAWKLKGIASLHCSDFTGFNHSEVITSFRKAIEHDRSIKLKKEITKSIFKYTTRFNDDGSSYLINNEFVFSYDLDFYFDSSIKSLELLQFALDVDTKNKEIAKLIIEIVDDVTRNFKIKAASGGSTYYSLSEENEQKVLKVRSKAVKTVKMTEPDYQAPDNPNKTVNLTDSNCFVVTATTGSSSNKIVNDYREYRDNFLSKKFYGKFLIDIYYVIGPYLASLIKKNSFLKKVILEYLIKPIHKIITDSK